MRMNITREDELRAAMLTRVETKARTSMKTAWMRAETEQAMAMIVS